MSILCHSSHKSLSCLAMSASGKQEGSSCDALERRWGCRVPLLSPLRCLCQGRPPLAATSTSSCIFSSANRGARHGTGASLRGGLFLALLHSRWRWLSNFRASQSDIWRSSDVFTSCQACRINVCHRGIFFAQHLVSPGGKKMYCPMWSTLDCHGFELCRSTYFF